MTIAFEIPQALLASVATGKVKLSGALLKDVTTGRIVGHVQQASGAIQQAGGLARLLGGLDPINLAMQGYQINQLSQVQAGQALIQTLCKANLALTGVGIGLNLVGFAVIGAKLNRIQSQIGELAAAVEQVGRKVDAVLDWQVRQELADLRAELQRIDEAWDLEGDAANREWRLAADALRRIESRFLHHARALTDETGQAAAGALMREAFMLASEGRCEALLASGDSIGAETAARKYSAALTALTGRIGAADILRDLIAKEPPAALNERIEAIERLAPTAQAGAATLREREAMAASTPHTIAALRSRGIAGRTWLEAARTETERPILCLV